MEREQIFSEINARLYNDVERTLSHALQIEIGKTNPTLDLAIINRHIIHARDSLREIMRQFGYKGIF